MVRTPEMVADRWVRFTAERDPAIREQLVLQYAPLVKYVAGRLAIMLPRVMDSDDVISSGVLGLIEAIDRYDPTTGVKFETYAISRIRGAILDELRSLDWIPRSARQRSQEIAKAFTRLEAEYGRPPTDEEVAKDLKLAAPQKKAYIMKGLEVEEKALALNPNYADAIIIKNILLRQQARVESDPAVQKRLISEAEVLYKRGMELRKLANQATAEGPKDGKKEK